MCTLCRAARFTTTALCGVTLGLWATVALAQSLDMGGAAEAQPSAAPSPTLDLDVLATPAQSPVATSEGSSANVSAGITLRPPPGLFAPVVAAPPGPPPEPITLDKPKVVTTASLSSGNTTVSLFGIVGLPDDAAQGLQAFIAGNGAKVTCQQKPNAEFVCLLVDGTDLAMVSLVNGAAQTRTDSPDDYREQEAAAQSARRGIWSNLPPPPVQVSHPAVHDTATLIADGKTYTLDGVEGLGGSFARDLQGYIVAHDDSLMCQPQGKPDHYVCVLSDGTDIAKEALVNGAAKVAADAPDSYRVQQGEAVDKKRGIWANVTIAATTVAPVAATYRSYPTVAGDETDGVSYAGGVPSAMIDGEAVFLSFGGALGWGYYDHWHHWHGAPDRMRVHMERFHPGGSGLRGYPGGGMHPGGFAGPHMASAGIGHFAPGGFVHPAAGFGGGFHAAPVAHAVGSGGGGHHH